MAVETSADERRPPSEGALPPVMGFGALDRASVRWDGGTLHAAYSAEGDLVYRVTWAPKGCVLDSFFRGRQLGASGGPHLQRAFFYSLRFVKAHEDPRFQHLHRRVLQAGRNVYYLHPRLDTGYLFYPAGLIFRLRQPISAETRPAWERAKAAADHPALAPLIQSADERPGLILHLDRAGRVSSEPIVLVDLCAILFELPDAVRAVSEHGLSGPRKEDRLVVSDACLDWLDGMQVCCGDPRGDDLAYAVLAEGPLTADPDALARRFVARAAGVLADPSTEPVPARRHAYRADRPGQPAR